MSLRSVDLEFERLKLDHVDLLFIDTEGHDPSVLRGAQKALSSQRVTMVQYEFHMSKQ